MATIAISKIYKRLTIHGCLVTLSLTLLSGCEWFNRTTPEHIVSETSSNVESNRVEKENKGDSLDIFEPSIMAQWSIICDSTYQPIISDFYQENEGLKNQISEILNDNELIITSVSEPIVKHKWKEKTIIDSFFQVDTIPNPINLAMQKDLLTLRSDNSKLEDKNKRLNKYMWVSIGVNILLIILIIVIIKIF